MIWIGAGSGRAGSEIDAPSARFAATSNVRLQIIFVFMLIEISSCAERREYAMHLRGTHCVRSDRKTQISRAQSRWNSGMTKDEGEEAAAVETCAVADAGNVHATTVERSAVSCCWFAAGTEAVECCGVSLVACATQQHVFCALQQPHLTGTEEVICTAANA